MYARAFHTFIRLSLFSRVRLLLVVLLTILSGCASFSGNPPLTEVPVQYDVAERANAVTLQTHDHLTLFGQWWLPDADTPPKAVVLLVHGTYVHSGFYADWAQHLADNGYAVFGFDMRGWGQSQGQGRRGFVKGFNDYLGDLQLSWSQVKERFPHIPLYLQGESLGGLVSLLSQQRDYMPVEGMILNAPAIQPALEVGLVRTPQWIASSMLWAWSLPGEISPNMPVPVPGAVSEMFAGSPWTAMH